MPIESASVSDLLHPVTVVISLLVNTVAKQLFRATRLKVKSAATASLPHWQQEACTMQFPNKEEMLNNMKQERFATGQLQSHCLQDVTAFCAHLGNIACTDLE